MCLRICVHIHTSIHRFLHIQTSFPLLYVFVCTHMSLCWCMHDSMYACVGVCMSMHTSHLESICVYKYAYIAFCKQVCVRVRIHHILKASVCSSMHASHFESIYESTDALFHIYSNERELTALYMCLAQKPVVCICVCACMYICTYSCMYACTVLISYEFCIHT
jgi:hypothetical protein